MNETKDLIVIPVASHPALTPRKYQELLWTIEAARQRSILIDLTRAQGPHMLFFRSLAESTNIPRHMRVGVRVTFERWAELRSEVELIARQLTSKGVEIALFYEEQDYATWYAEGQVIHNVEAVIQKLSGCSALAMQWPLLLDAAALLLDGCGANRRAEALVALAQMALDCGALKNALTLSHEALLFANILPPALECKARRTLGLALIPLGQAVNGIACVDQAIALGRECGAYEDAATAAYELGVHAVIREDYEVAGRRYGEALGLCPADPSELRGKLHAALAGVLIHQSKNTEAVAHVQLALKMRVVSPVRPASDRQEPWHALLRLMPEMRTIMTRSLLR